MNISRAISRRSKQSEHQEHYPRHRRGRTASLTGSWEREARWQIIKAHDGRTVRAYLMNTGKLGDEALRRRMRDGWVELIAPSARRAAEGSFNQHDIRALMRKQKSVCFYCDQSNSYDTTSIISSRCRAAARIGRRTFGLLASPATVPSAI